MLSEFDLTKGLLGFPIKHFPIGRRSTEVDDVHYLTARESGLVCGKTGNIPSCYLPYIAGGKLARFVSTAEIVYEEVVCTVVTVVDSLKFLRESLGRLNG